MTTIAVADEAGTPLQPAVTDAQERFLAAGGDLPTPLLDLDVVASRYRALRAALPEATVYYAIKANPAPEVVALLARLGSCFDVASPGEIERCLGLGVAPAQLSYGNTIK